MEEKKEISSEEIEKFLASQDEKDVTQSDSIDENVEEFMKEMGFITQLINKRITEQNKCFECSNKLYNDHTKDKNLFLVELNQKKDGVVVIAGLCKVCYDKLRLANQDKGE